MFGPPKSKDRQRHHIAYGAACVSRAKETQPETALCRCAVARIIAEYDSGSLAVGFRMRRQGLVWVCKGLGVGGVGILGFEASKKFKGWGFSVFGFSWRAFPMLPGPGAYDFRFQGPATFTGRQQSVILTTVLPAIRVASYTSGITFGHPGTCDDLAGYINRNRLRCSQTSPMKNLHRCHR